MTTFGPPRRSHATAAPSTPARRRRHRPVLYAVLAALAWVLLAGPASAAPRELGSDGLHLAGPVQLRLVNGFWLVAPLLAFNALMASRLPPAYTSDERVPATVAWTEGLLRVPVFVAPLLLPLRVGDPLSRAGWIGYGVGSALYLASWIAQIHLPDSRFSRSLLGRLAPAFTPLLWLAGIAMIGGSWPYAAVSGAFVAAHVFRFTYVF